jgi:hypothetical protein
MKVLSFAYATSRPDATYFAACLRAICSADFRAICSASRRAICAADLRAIYAADLLEEERGKRGNDFRVQLQGTGGANLREDNLGAGGK